MNEPRDVYEGYGAPFDEPARDVAVRFRRHSIKTHVIAGHSPSLAAPEPERGKISGIGRPSARSTP